MSDLPTPTTKAPWLGMSIGVNDRTGKPIHIGDLLHFDSNEWGSDDHYFCVEFSRGEVRHSGSVADLSEWCVIVRKWNADAPDASHRRPDGRFATQELPSPLPNGPEVWPVVLSAFSVHEHAALRAEIEARRDLGVARYGQTVHRDDGRPLGVDAFQEALDLLVYLTRDRMRVGDGDGSNGDLALDLDAAIASTRRTIVVLHRALFRDAIGRMEVRFGLTQMQRAKIAKARAQDVEWSDIAYELGWEVETLKRYYAMGAP